MLGSQVALGILMLKYFRGESPYGNPNQDRYVCVYMYMCVAGYQNQGLRHARPWDDLGCLDVKKCEKVSPGSLTPAPPRPMPTWVWLMNLAQESQAGKGVGAGTWTNSV